MPKNQKAIFAGFLALFLIGFFWWSSKIYFRYTKIVPTFGGEFREAMIGNPRYINPVLADTQEAEGAIEALVFSSLFKPDGHGGLEPDLAENYTVSEDRKEYFVTLKEGVTWHDGAKLSVDDVIFTLNLIKEPLLQSPFISAWQEVKIEKISNRTIKFTLNSPYEYFLQNLTFRILPQHLWSQIPLENFRLAEFNIRPIGSGPYRFKALERDQYGTIISYTLSANPNYFRKRPYIDTIRLKFYRTADDAILAWKKGEVDAFGSFDALSVAKIGEENLYKIPTSRQFFVFFNTDSAVLNDKRLREALILATNFSEFEKNVLGNFGKALEISRSYNLEAAITQIENAGWKTTNETGVRSKGSGKNSRKLSIEFIIPAGEFHKKTAEFLAEGWKKIGIDVKIVQLDAAELSSRIRLRKYDLILLGILFGPEPDLFPFWHSSQIDYPGLNLSRLEYKKLDSILETIRKESSSEKRNALRSQALSLINEHLPGIALYTPYYFYLVSPKIQFQNPEVLGMPEERFGRIYEWFIMTKRKWGW